MNDAGEEWALSVGVPQGRLDSGFPIPCMIYYPDLLDVYDIFFVMEPWEDSGCRASGSQRPSQLAVLLWGDESDMPELWLKEDIYRVV